MAEKPEKRKEEEKKRKKKRAPVYNLEPAEEPVHGPEGREPYRV
ncbi:MAG TPA: hypothetical protein VMC61_03480 [Methanocella sp.]|nr:hypothetical protein [Methanocella sp.]